MIVLMTIMIFPRAQFMRDLRDATIELLMQGLSIEEVRISDHGGEGDPNDGGDMYATQEYHER